LSLDDLLGLLFLLVFVVGPILKGLFQGSGEAPLFEVELEEPPAEPEAAPRPPEPETKGEQPRVRPVRVAPPPERKRPSSPPPEPKSKGARAKLKLRFRRGSILEGVVWHEILSEPRARRRWKPKR